MDFKNQRYKMFNTEKIMQWRLILRHYRPKLIYIQGSKYITVDTLSRSDMVDTSTHPFKTKFKSDNDDYLLEDDNIAHPINCKTIMQNQKDEELIKIIQNDKDYSIQNLHGVDKKNSLICRN